jgi:integrase/recombinase XerD
MLIIILYSQTVRLHLSIAQLKSTLSTEIKTSNTTAVITSLTSPLLDQKIDEITAGLPASFGNNLRSLPNQQNIPVIIQYIQAMKTETNLADHYRQNIIEGLTRFSKYKDNNNKSFGEISRDDIIAFLDHFRKTETVDPLHKWIGTYNLFRTLLIRFFKWLYSPDIDPDKRPKPPMIENIPKLKRKETSIYKPSDLWTQQDDLLFLKYCPSKREKCYHAVSRDLSCRPSEILKLKIRDIFFKNIGTAQYAEVVVNGKTGTRLIPLINSIPYLKDYLNNEHPMPSNPNAPLICGTKGLGKHIKPIRITHIYEKYKKRVFPSLLELPNVVSEDKQQIKELLKKPWNPYIRRHSALTEKSSKLREHVLRQHAGWTPGSNMHLKYLHYYGNESNESLLEAYGLVDKVQIDQLRPKQCPNCQEGNKPDSKFCVKCNMVLTYDSYLETVQGQKEKEDRLSTVEDQLKSMVSVLRNMKGQSKNEFAKNLFLSGIFKKE